MKDRRVLIVSIILAVVIFSIVPLIRIVKYDSLHSGVDPYYHERMAEHIHQHGIPSVDPLMTRPYLLQPYHYLLSLFVPLGAFKASIMIPFWLGIFSVILAYMILNEFNLSATRKLVIMSIFIISPVSVFLFSTSNLFALPVFIFLLGFYLFIKDSWLSVLVLSLMSLFNPLLSFAALAILLSYTLNFKRNKFYFILGLVTLLSAIIHIPFYLKNGLPLIESSNFIIQFVSDFGANLGFGIFSILLAIFGLVVFWRIKKQLVPYGLIVFLVILVIYYAPLAVFLNLIVSAFAGYGFLLFVRRDWDISVLKKFTILVLICGLLFSSMSYINRVANEEPLWDVVKSLDWLSTKEDGYVLSHSSNGYLIQSMADKRTLTDTGLYADQSKINVSNDIFMSRNLVVTRQLLHENDISYIWITSEMKEGQVWTKDDQGLLFLLRNNETFKNIYGSKHAEIWQVIS